MRRWHQLIVARSDDLSAILTAEMGKPLAEAKSEISHAAAYVQWYAEEANRIYGETISAPSNDRRMLVIKQPVGVVGTITPWNFPASMVARKISPALAAGCAIVLTPAEQTPLVAGAMFALAERAGFPAGVLNLIYASEGAAVGHELCTNAKVRKISFTGSTEVGRLQAAEAKAAGTIFDRCPLTLQCPFLRLLLIKQRRMHESRICIIINHTLPFYSST
ncbi:MAG: NAD-dependent succinate-semialdehyde dehydrogenase [Rhizobium sp.]|nr:NAD-dependent succinate-semialdehyde dehydrogenase [Rhizobium sp.]